MKWLEEERSVTMTNAMWATLRGVLLMTNNVWEDECQTWSKLARETEADGTPKYKNAIKNYQFWANLQADVKQILERIG